jgi:hypothetical protein
MLRSSVSVGWLLMLLFIAAVIAAVAVIIWSFYHQHAVKEKKNRTWVSLSADDVQTGDLVELSVVTGLTGGVSDSGYLTVLSTTITTNSWMNRLYSTVSAFTSIGTLDLHGTLGSTQLSTEIASIDVQVLIDGVLAQPGTVTFDSVTHVLGSELSEEEALLLIESRGATHSFGFITRDIGPGLHHITVQARAVASAVAAPALIASCTAVIGDRSLIVQTGRVSRNVCSSSSSSG